ncbi:hypothetical protein THAOC_32114, partial [Thalassiosira oceanica]
PGRGPRQHEGVGFGVSQTARLAISQAGQYTQNVQYETVRKSVTWIGNMYEAGASYSGAPTTDAPSSDGGAVRVLEPDAAQVVREVHAGRQAEDGTGQVPERAFDVRDGGDGFQVALPSHQRSVRQQNPVLEVDRNPAAPTFGRSGPPGGLAVCQEGREDQGTDQGLTTKWGLHPIHGDFEGEPAGAVLGRHVDGALFPSLLDALRGGPDDDGQGG